MDIETLYVPTKVAISRVMQLSYNLNKRAEVIEELSKINLELKYAIKNKKQKTLERVESCLDNLIQNEKHQLLQETKKPKGSAKG